MRNVRAHLAALTILTVLAVCPRISDAQTRPTPPGVAAVAIDIAGTRQYRAGLVIGRAGWGLSASIVLVGREALYSKDLELARAVGIANGAAFLPGQILEVSPARITFRQQGYPLELAFLALSTPGEIPTAACLGVLRPGQSADIFTSASGSASIERLSGRIDRVEPDGFTIIAQGQRLPRPGDPVFVSQQVGPPSPDLSSRVPQQDTVAGIVAATSGGGSIQVANLATVFRALSPDAATWNIQPRGACAYVSRGAAGPPLSVEDHVGQYLKKAIELTALAGRPLNFLLSAADRQQILKDRPAWRDLLDQPSVDRSTLLLAAEWTPLRDALTAPGVEQYYFKRDLPDPDRLAHFNVSLASAMSSRSDVLTVLQASGAVFKVRTKRVSDTPIEGWSVGAGLLDGQVNNLIGNSTPVLLVVTARHVVEAGPDAEIWVYPPSLQGVGLRARRTPFENPSLDIALLAVEATPEVAREAFRATGTSCAGSLSGPAEIPVETWGWRRAALRGTITPGARPDEILVNGTQVAPGLSGAALLQDKLYVAGLLVSNTGDHANGVSLRAAMSLLPPGTAVLSPRADCPPPSLEARATVAMQRQLLGQKAIRDATASDLRLLYGETAARVDLTRLPSFDIAWGDQPNGFWQAVRTRRMEAYCATVLPQSPRPTASDVEAGKCDLARFGQSGLSATLNLAAALPVCRVSITFSDRSTFGGSGTDRRNVITAPIAFSGGNFWNAASIFACNGPLRVTRYVPDDWVRTVSLAAPQLSLVRVEGGTVRMSGCGEWKLSGNSFGANFGPSECTPHPAAPPFDVNSPGFLIGRIPVLVSQYAKCVTDGKCRYSAPRPDIFLDARIGEGARLRCNWGEVERGLHPMNCVTWQQAREFCQSNGGDLPSDVQWEKAISGPLPADPGISRLVERWGTMQAGLAPTLRTTYGLEDVIWHVAEWTAAEYSNYSGRPLARGLKGDRVVRGLLGRPYARTGEPANEQRHYVGFRCVFPLKPVNSPT